MLRSLALVGLAAVASHAIHAHALGMGPAPPPPAVWSDDRMFGIWIEDVNLVPPGRCRDFGYFNSDPSAMYQVDAFHADFTWSWNANLHYQFLYQCVPDCRDNTNGFRLKDEWMWSQFGFNLFDAGDGTQLPIHDYYKSFGLDNNDPSQWCGMVYGDLLKGKDGGPTFQEHLETLPIGLNGLMPAEWQYQNLMAGLPLRCDQHLGALGPGSLVYYQVRGAQWAGGTMRVGNVSRDVWYPYLTSRPPYRLITGYHLCCETCGSCAKVPEGGTEMDRHECMPPDEEWGPYPCGWDYENCSDRNPPDHEYPNYWNNYY